MRRLLGLYAAAAYAFLHLPLAVLVVFSFNSSRFTVWEGLSLTWYRAAFRDPHTVERSLLTPTVTADRERNVRDQLDAATARGYFWAQSGNFVGTSVRAEGINTRHTGSEIRFLWMIVSKSRE